MTSKELQGTQVYLYLNSRVRWKMMGYKVREFRPLTKVSLEDLVPLGHFYRHVDVMSFNFRMSDLLRLHHTSLS